MGNFSLLRKVNAINHYFQQSKLFLLSLGVSANKFQEAEKALNQLNDEVKKSTAGGIITGNNENNQVEGGEYIINNRKK